MTVAAIQHRKLPTDAGIFMILIAIALLFEGHGWMLDGKGFLGNPQWLQIFILQLAIIGILAEAVT